MKKEQMIWRMRYLLLPQRRAGVQATATATTKKQSKMKSNNKNDNSLLPVAYQ
jgi:hypothetical protein